MNILEKKETKIAAIAVSIILVIVLAVMLFNQNNIKQTKDSLVHEAGQELVFDAKDYFDVDDEAAAQITFDASKVNTTAVGEYEAVANYKGKKYTIKVEVVDTTAPKAEFAHRYVFANDAANADFAAMFESVRDASESTAKLIRFERKGNLSVMDEKALKSLTDAIDTYADDETLKAFGTEAIPAEEGIYCAVMEIVDVHGNAAYEEIVLILDKTGAKIEDTPDRVIKVSKEELTGTPVIEKSEYSITDNVDGKIKASDITCELELRDESKHEWLVHVSYVDRAGNESKSTFLITVQEGTQSEIQSGNHGSVTTTPDTGNNGNAGNAGNGDSTNQSGSTNQGGNNGSSNQNGNPTPSTKPTPDGGNGGSTNQGSNTGNGGSTNQGGTTNQGGNTGDGGSSNAGSNTGNVGNVNTEEDKKPSNNQDVSTWNPEDYDENEINPYQQMLIDAGYGNVVHQPDGTYAVLVHADNTANGKNGRVILEEYLAERDLQIVHSYAGIIDEANDWYVYEVTEVRELITPDEEDFWD